MKKKKKIRGERVGRRERARKEMKNESHSSSLQSWEIVVCLKRFELGQIIGLAQQCNNPFKTQGFSIFLLPHPRPLGLCPHAGHLMDLVAGPPRLNICSSGKSQVCPLVSGGERQNFPGSQTHQTSPFMLLASIGSYPLSIFPSSLSPEP